MNKVIISGNLTRDPETRYTTGENSNAYTRFSVACQRARKNADGTRDADFPNVVAWGKTAEFISKWFHKGDRIEIVGELRTGSYTNKDGQKVYTTDVWASEAGFGGKASAGNETQSAEQPKSNNDFMNIPDTDEDDLPF